MVRKSTAAMVCTVLGVAVASVGQSEHRPISSSALIARGKYLVDHVSKCGDCHTPRGEKGQPIISKYLQGGDLGVQPIAPNPAFTSIAPDISAKGLTGWSIADLTKALQTGKRPNGEMFRPPMPDYTMKRRDAEAVATYLKSLR